MTQSHRTATDSALPRQSQPSRRMSRDGSNRPAKRIRTNPLQAALLWGAVSVAALVVATATFLIIATPTDLLRDQIVQEVRKQTGRDLLVSGGASLKLFPSIGLSLHDVSLSSPPGTAGEPMARVAEMEIETPLRQLLGGELKVERVVLRRPELDLLIDADGRRNWVFDRPDRAPAAPKQGASGTSPGNGLDVLQTIPLANVLIEGGTLRYADKQREIVETINDINLEVGIASLTSPLKARGELTLRGQKLDVRASLDSLSALLAGAPSQLAVRVSGEPVEATYEGTISTSPGTKLTGALAVKAPSVRALAAWFGTSLPEEEDGPVQLAGKLETTATAVALTETSAQIADQALEGFAVLERRSGSRPRLSAELRMSALDLGRWLRPDGDWQRDAAPRNRRDIGGAPGEPQRPRTIDDLLRGTKTDETQVRGFIARNGWSDVPFDFDALGNLDADLRLRTDQLIYRDIQAGTTQITATLTDRVMDATIDQMQLYGGTGSGLIRLDASGSIPAVRAELQLDGVSALNLLRDAAEFDWIDGKSRIILAVAGEGRSEREIVETLDGSAQFAFRDGALVGLDIPGMISALQQGRIPRLERNETDRTRFSELTASFALKDGIAENRDLRIESPVIRATGSGTASLPRRTLDYTVRPVLAISPATERDKAAGVELPIRITGSWDHPTYTADFDAVLKNPDDVIEAVKEIGKKLKGKNLDDALQGLLGGGKGDEGGRKPKAGDLLRQFLKP